MPLVDQPGFNASDYVTDGGTFNAWKYYFHNLPEIIGRWIGRGVNSYTQSSTEFERDWNSPANQMQQYAEGNVNPYEGFLSGSGGNGNPISTGSMDPLVEIGNIMGNFLSLAQGLQDLRSKKLANDSSQIDLLRKRFENRWFFGDPGTPYSYETVNDKGEPVVVVGKKGYVKSKPERDYEGQVTSNLRQDLQKVGDEYNAVKFQYGIENGFPQNDSYNESWSKYWNRLDTEYRASRNKIEYEWEKYLKEDLGLDPRLNPWWTTVANLLGKIIKSNPQIGRWFFGLLKYSQNDYPK